jgi:hypothetical protein
MLSTTMRPNGKFATPTFAVFCAVTSEDVGLSCCTHGAGRMLRAPNGRQRLRTGSR